MYNPLMTGLYVHIPFCIKKCHYCNFVITGAGSKPKERRFLEIFEKEAAHYKARFAARRFSTLYLGGGTPSAISSKDLEKVFSILRKNFRFQKEIEITCEANPGDITVEKARTLKALGVNRISLGAQTFHDRTLKKLNRAHGVQDIFDSFSRLRKEGFSNISLDLMLALPGETVEDVHFSLEQIARLSPEHVSVYELVIEDKTVFGRRHALGKLLLPPEEIQTQMLSNTRDFLKAKGYAHYELLSYARRGFQSRHNRIYWANGQYLGLGPGAFSYFGGRRFRNSSDFDDYMAKTAAGTWSAYEEETLSAEKKETESFLLALRLLEGASVKKFTKFLKKMNPTVKDLTEKGLLVAENQKIRLTPQGQFFAETVFSEFSAP